MEAEELPLAEAFRRYFEVDLATTPAQKDAIYRIRYRVYCEEFGYESADDFADAAEQDEFDDHSLHCLITHRQSGQPAGCVRVVSAHSGQLLPLEKYCHHSLDQGYLPYLAEPREQVCEFSRLAVDTSFRRRPGEQHTRFGNDVEVGFSEMERRTFPLISVAAFLASFAVAELSGQTNVFAMMEGFLPRMLQRSNIDVEKAGMEVDYHGARAPYFIRSGVAVGSLSEDLRELYNVIHARMAQAIVVRESSP